MNLIKAAERTLEIIDERCSTHRSATTHETSWQHLGWMLIEIKAGRKSKGKGNRWLGYVQGVLVAQGLATVDEFRVINSEEH